MPQDNAKTLFEKLIPLGLDGLKECLEQIEKGHIVQTPQEGEPTLAPMLEKEDALLRPELLTAAELNNRARGLACGPKPKVPFTHNGKTEWLQVVRTELGDNTSNEPAGTVLFIERNRGILVKCKEGSIWLNEVHPAGKKPMAADAFANGRGLKAHDGAFRE